MAELFDPEDVDAAFRDLENLVQALADDRAWDREVALPGPLEPEGDGGLSLGGSAAAGADAEASTIVAPW